MAEWTLYLWLEAKLEAYKTRAYLLVVDCYWYDSSRSGGASGAPRLEPRTNGRQCRTVARWAWGGPGASFRSVRSLYLFCVNFFKALNKTLLLLIMPVSHSTWSSLKKNPIRTTTVRRDSQWPKPGCMVAVYMGFLLRIDQVLREAGTIKKG